MTKNDAIRALRERFALGGGAKLRNTYISQEEADAIGVFDDQDDGWIEWGGGECPVGKKVEVKLKGGNQGVVTADSMQWNHTGDGGDIIAYRIHRED